MAMLEPGPNEAERTDDNLKMAVEIGQRLLHRNQELVEEQVALNARMVEREARILELEDMLQSAGDVHARKTSGVWP